MLVLRRSQVHLRVTVVVLQKWWSSVNGDPGDYGCSFQLAGRAPTVRVTRNVSRTRCSGTHGGRFK